MAGGGRVPVILRRVIFLNVCNGRPGVHEPQSAPSAFHYGKNLIRKELPVRHLIHDSLPLGPAQIARDILQANSSPAFRLPGPCSSSQFPQEVLPTQSRKHLWQQPPEGFSGETWPSGTAAEPVRVLAGLSIRKSPLGRSGRLFRRAILNPPRNSLCGVEKRPTPWFPRRTLPSNRSQVPPPAQSTLRDGRKGPPQANRRASVRRWRPDLCRGCTAPRRGPADFYV